jgi:hypothetical protein
MSFFNPPPPVDPPAPRRFPGPPEWSAPPGNVLGQLVHDRVDLARTDHTWVFLEHLRAYPKGFEFRIGVRSPNDLLPVVYAMPGGPIGGGYPRHGRESGGMSLGLGYADGRRLTNLAPVIDVATPAPTPLLVQVGGYAAVGRSARLFWHWGLPPAGSLALVIEMESVGVPETRVELDTAPLLEAAGRAEVLWVDDEPPGRGRRPHPFRQHLVFAPDPAPDAGPADADAAEREVRAAFEAMSELVGNELVNVEDGVALAPVMREVVQRFGSMATDAQQRVERVTWVSDTEGAVVFTVWVNGGPFLSSQRGTAKLMGGRWKMSRATFAGLMANVGVTVPGV